MGLCHHKIGTLFICYKVFEGCDHLFIRVSKENIETGIVQMGLFIGNNGLPITYELFPGNTHDLATIYST